MRSLWFIKQDLAVMIPLSTIIFPECRLLLFSVFHFESQCQHTFPLLRRYATACKITTSKTSNFLKKKNVLSNKIFMLILGKKLISKKVW